MHTRHDWRASNRDEILISLAGEGLSASQIAALFGPSVTRNAVIGRVSRIRRRGIEIALKGNVQHIKPDGVRAKSISAARTRKRGGIRGGEVSLNRLKTKPLPVLPDPAPEPVCSPIPLMALTATTCRFPVEGECEHTLFCGAECDPLKSYCDYHRARSCQPGQAA